MVARIIAGSVLLLALWCTAFAQELPSKIDGYKVYSANVVVTNEPIKMPKGVDVLVRLDEPKVSSVGLTGANVAISGEISSVRSGRVERVIFRDFRINGVAVDVEAIKPDIPIRTRGPQPVDISVKVTLGPLGLAKVGYRELTDPKRDWQVTGTMLVFGRFDRLGFAFKRVIPVKVSLTVKNPLRSR